MIGAAALVGALVLLITTWFGGWPRGLPVFVPLLVLAGLLAWPLRKTWPLPLPRPAVSTLVCLVIALVYRAPALLHPWGWVNRDGAYGAFVALHLLRGVRPAPAFTEGANYQGTLKGHLAALLSLVTGVDDLSWLMVAASVVLSLVFLVSTMALARRLGGEPAAWICGLCLALGPRFLTVFSLNCVGQYVDVLALGGVALALCARLLDGGSERLHLHFRTSRYACRSKVPGGDCGAGHEPGSSPSPGPPERGTHFLIGLLLGAAFWQQPVALSYIATVALVLALRRASWRWDGWPVLALGIAVGVLPVIVWNLQNAWASGDILGREPSELKAQIDALPYLVRRAVTVSFPILAGMSPAHPWTDVPLLRPAISALIPLAFLAYLALRGRVLWDGLRRGTPSAALLPPLLTLACLALFWSVASGRVYWRPRYLLPLLAPLALHLGVVLGALWRRSPTVGRPTAALLLAGILAVNVAGMLPRLQASGEIAAPYERLVRSLRDKGIRTGYSDFTLSAPVTMFTAEEIVLSPALGPTPAYESELHARTVRENGPDAFVLIPQDDPQLFAAALQRLGVTYVLDTDPVPIFYRLSRRVPVEEVAGFRGGEVAAEAPVE
jgi:hypothetical protein